MYFDKEVASKPKTLKIKLISLKAQFHRELIAESLVRKHYLTDLQRDNYKVGYGKKSVNGVEKKIAVDRNNQPLNGRYLFVLMYENNQFHLYAAKENGPVRNHSHLSNGKPVAGAGYLQYKDGKLELFSNESGHYKPTAKEMYWALIYFLLQSRNNSLLFEVHSQSETDPNEVKVNKYFAKEICENKTLSTSTSLFFPESKVSSRYSGAPKQWRVKDTDVTENKSTQVESKNESQGDSDYEEELKVRNPLSLLDDDTSSEEKAEQLDGYDKSLKK